MDFSTELYKVREKQQVSLKDFPTSADGGMDKETSVELLNNLKKELFELQEKLYADNKKSLLIIFQAKDAAGKDSAIKHVMSGLNPQGCQVYSFKQPNSEELDHDFLWRHYKALPERGRIGIHNRSHYENVLVCKVHPEYAAKESNVPITQIDKDFWNSRYSSIRNFEEHLTETGTVILKFFLHISKHEQKKRFLKRIEDGTKNWKFSSADLDERKLWTNYMEAYQDAFTETSTEKSPWFVIPSDKKWFARVAICQIILEKFKAMDLNYPVLSQTELENLEVQKETLLSENDSNN
ncbi:polyphosphate kinase 2 family protein [Pedobacter sp. P351]|uniref:polyphosphate kinase 2 family protein n=1 Tax=Pedobacter superstes TaxID=3133441 RepID=UPI0030B18E40